jgi:hypothetical protein
MNLNKKDFYCEAISKLTNSDVIISQDRNTKDIITYDLKDKSKTMPSQSEIDTKAQELLDAHNLKIQNEQTKKASGKQKLKDLGLNDDEIQAIIGV